MPVIPIYLDELWGSIFSYYAGRAFWKWPRKWRYPVPVLFGPPIERPDEVQQIRQGMERLRIDAVERARIER